MPVSEQYIKLRHVCLFSTFLESRGTHHRILRPPPYNIYTVLLSAMSHQNKEKNVLSAEDEERERKAAEERRVEALRQSVEEAPIPGYVYAEHARLNLLDDVPLPTVHQIDFFGPDSVDPAVLWDSMTFNENDELMEGLGNEEGVGPG